jgi:hypothetical protein
MGLAANQYPAAIIATETPTPTAVINASPTAIVNASTPTPMPTVIPTPEPGIAFSYEDWVYWVVQYYYNGTLPDRNATHIDPLSQEAYDLWTKKNAMATPVPPVRIDDSNPYGSRIYGSPTPTPTPAPAPVDPFSRETHTYVINPGLIDLQVNAMQNGYLSLADMRGVYQYYHPGDYAMMRFDFLNTNPNTVTNPIVKVEINRTDKYGHIMPWISNEAHANVTIPAAKWDYDMQSCQPTSFSYTYELGIIPNVVYDNGKLLDIRGSPENPGIYQISVTIYNADKSLVLCWISWQVNML